MPAEPTTHNSKVGNSKMPNARPKRLPYDNAAVQALADLAPELGLLWVVAETNRCVSERRSLSPALYRTLISYMLRAASRYDADSAFEALKAAMSLPLETPGALLGFTSQAMSAHVANVLCDLTASAARDEPLLCTSHALAQYSEAGPGAADQDEYHNASTDHRAAFAEQQEPLSEVRTYNLAQMLIYMAMIFEKKGPTAMYLSQVLSLNDSMWLAPFTESFSKAIKELDSNLCEALRRLYAAYMAIQREGKKYEIKGKLVDTCMRMSHDQPEALCLYLDMIGDASMKLRVCRWFLKQRFKVHDDPDDKPFTLMLLHDFYLAKERFERRYCRVYPPVLASMIMAWFEMATASELQAPFTRLPPERREEEVVNLIRSMKSHRKRLNSVCQTFGEDRVTFNAAIHLLTTEIIRECTSLWS